MLVLATGLKHASFHIFAFLWMPIRTISVFAIFIFTVFRWMDISNLIKLQPQPPQMPTTQFETPNLALSEGD